MSAQVLKDYDKTREYWESKRVRIIDDIQHWMMDRFLKSNGVTEGAKDYYGVIGIIMTMDKDSGNDNESVNDKPVFKDNPQEFFI